MAQNPSLIPWLHFSGARDETGAPVSSGFAYFYAVHSTSVLVTVYSDDAATPLAQPVPLDAAGRAEVYIRDNCEVIIKDAAGATKRLSNNATFSAAPLVVAQWGGQNVALDTILATIEVALAAVAPVVPSDAVALTTISTASPSFTFDKTKPLNIFKATYGGAMGTLTIGGVYGLTQYAKYRVIIQTGNSSTATATIIDGSIKTSTPPTTLAAATCYSAEFEAASAAALVQVTPWVTVAGLWW
jgi:hypothetical protein